MEILEIIKKDLCISCGACEYVAKGKIRIKESRKRGIFIPEISSPLSNTENKEIERICPGNGYPIISLADKIHSDAGQYDYKIGKYISFKAIKSNSSNTLNRASSGGIMTELAKYLLEKNYVQGIIATSFDYSDGNVIPKTEILTTGDDLIKTQGSKYMPVPALTILDELEKFDGQVAYIGTPCQIASLRLIQENNPAIKSKIKFFIGNFCGGFRDMRELYRLRDIAGMKSEHIIDFQYRGSGQPGKMIFKSKSKHWEYNYPDYAELTGFMKYYRCRVCVDATAELADISCGDAWLKRFEELGNNWSVTIIRNIEILDILKEMKELGRIIEEPLSYEEIVHSQRQNLYSKKERFLGRNSFLSKLNYVIPVFDGGWNDHVKTSFVFEAKVFLFQKIKYYLELFYVYRIANKIARKLFNK